MKHSARFYFITLCISLIVLIIEVLFKIKGVVGLILCLTSVYFVIGLIIKSRMVSQENFDLLVLMETNEVLENCSQRIKTNQIGKLNNISYDHEMYNYYISKYGEDFCTDANKVKTTIEKDYRQSLKEQWKFVF